MQTLKRKVLVARLALFWERLWPKCFYGLMVAGVFALAGLSGVLELLPQVLHIAVLAGFAIALAVALYPARLIRWPSHTEALRHLEATSAVPHRPASSYQDTLTLSKEDPYAQSLWRRHRERLMQALRKLRPAWPKSYVRNKDPYALRAALLLCLAIAFAWSGSDWSSRVTNAFVPGNRANVPVWLDAWVKPPEYTSMPPIFLSGQNSIQSVTARDRVPVPTGSEIVIRLSGAEAPIVSFAPIAAEGAAPSEAATPPLAALDSGVHELRAALKEPVTVTVQNGAETLESWSFDIIPDAPPRIEVDGEVERTVNGAMRFIYKASDDYGVSSVRADIQLSDEQEGGMGISYPGLLRVAPPDFPVPLPSINPRSAEQMVYQDLTAHPWAGLVVEMTLVAEDQAGNAARSVPYVFALPQREFTQPLARAVIEQRRHLIREPDLVGNVVLALTALGYYPDDLFASSGIYLGMRFAINRMRRDDEGSIDESIDLLWELALAIEDGDLSVAERELREAQRALQEALARDASPEEIAQLVEKLRDAMQRYVRALAERAQDSQRSDNRIPEDATQVSPQDLEKMLDTIENLARAGANDAAQDMLSQLQNMLENMQAGRDQRGLSGRDAEMARLLEQLGQLMSEQQDLMDETFQTPQSNGAEPGSRGGALSDMEELAELQEGLAMSLEEMLNSLQRRGVDGPTALDQAGDAMRDAIEALRRDDQRGAVGSQGEALDQLREGAQTMAQQMMQGNGSQGALGRHGRGDNDTNRDPLGRPLHSSGPELGLSTRVPSEIEIQRARQILRELQNRIGERMRPRIELDYLNRLLERF